MKKRLWIPMLVVAVAVVYVALRWDYHVSKYMFEKICSDPDRVGLFIYEKVGLGKEYFIELPETKDLHELDQRFVVDDHLLIDRNRLELDYIIGEYKRSILFSELGPIKFNETSIYRRSDGMLLGKAVSVLNGKGWWHQKIVSFGQNSFDRCPPGYDEFDLAYSDKSHYNLIKNVFYMN